MDERAPVLISCQPPEAVRRDGLSMPERLAATGSEARRATGWQQTTGGIRALGLRLRGWWRAGRVAERLGAVVAGRLELRLPGLPGPVAVAATEPWLHDWLAGGAPWQDAWRRFELWEAAGHDLLLIGAGEGAWALGVQHRLPAGRRVLAVETRPTHAPLLFENTLRPAFGHRLEAGGVESLAAAATKPGWQFGLVWSQPEAGVAATLARLGRLLTNHRPVILLPLDKPLLQREGSSIDAVIGRLHGHGYTLQSADNPARPVSADARLNGWVAARPSPEQPKAAS